MEKTVSQIDGSKQQDVVKGLRKAGFRLASLNRPVPQDEIADIVKTLSNTEKRNLSSGRARIVPRGRAEFSDKNGSVTSIDFDIEEEQMVRVDPVIIVKETVPNTVSLIVREILEEIVTVDIIKAALVSVSGRKFKTSVRDLARVTGEEPNVVYNRCVNTLVRSCVSGFKRIEVSEKSLMPQKQMQKISPRAV